MATETLEPGVYIGAPWGHYQSPKIIELARELGWEPEDAEDVDLMAVVYLEQGNLSDSAIEVFYEIVQEAEDWINENRIPEGYWFGHHPDMGDVGVWELEEE